MSEAASEVVEKSRKDVLAEIEKRSDLSEHHNFVLELNKLRVEMVERRDWRARITISVIDYYVKKVRTDVVRQRAIVELLQEYLTVLQKPEEITPEDLASVVILWEKYRGLRKQDFWRGAVVGGQIGFMLKRAKP